MPPVAAGPPCPQRPRRFRVFGESPRRRPGGRRAGRSSRV